MSNLLSTRLKKGTKRWLGRVVYSCVYSKNRAVQRFRKVRKGAYPSKKKPNFIFLILESWKAVFLVLALVLFLYYGIGIAISSKINNHLGVQYNVSSNDETRTIKALEYVLRTQIDDVAWTPALPIIFPAGILDNLPSFQLGAKDGVSYLLKHLNDIYHDKNLKEAVELLNYPPDIWLVSQTKNDKLAPGSAKQYRKSLAETKKFLNEGGANKEASLEDVLYILQSVHSLIDKEIAKLSSHIQEHSSETFDFRADDVFYHAVGVVYTLHYFLSAFAKDYQKQILDNEQYENITSLLKVLSDAENIKPIMVKNASFNDVYAANHLFYLAYYLSLAQNLVQEISYKILLKTMELKECE